MGGILANSTHPAEFLYDNLAIQTNVIHAAWQNGVQKLVFLGSSAMYPQLAPQPIKEEYLLTGPLEPTNEAYAIAKIAGLKLAAAYREQYGFPAISLMPSESLRAGRQFRSGIVASAAGADSPLSRGQNMEIAFGDVVGHGHAAARISARGRSGRGRVFRDGKLQRRGTLGNLLNVGSGEDLPIAELAELIARIVDYPGQIRFDPKRPDGAPRKLLDVSRMHSLGWRARISLEDGIASTYDWYCANAAASVAG